MLKEFLEYIGSQAVKAAVPVQVTPSAEPPHVYYLRSEDGTLERHEADPAPRSHRVLDIASLARFGKDHGVKFPETYLPILWYSRAGVTLITDDTTRRDRVYLPFEFSPQLTLLQALEKSQQWSGQGEFLRFLRVKLAGSLGQHPALIPSLRKIKFRQSGEGVSEVVQGRASVGKALSAELSGTEPIPEELALTVPVFNGRQELASIICSLDIDPEKQLFSITPLAGEIENGIRQAELRVREVIAQEMDVVSLKAPVYYGTP